MKKTIAVSGLMGLCVVGRILAMEPGTPFARTLADGQRFGSMDTMEISRDDLERSGLSSETPRDAQQPAPLLSSELAARFGVKLTTLETKLIEGAAVGPRTIAGKAAQIAQAEGKSTFRRAGTQLIFTGLGAFAVDKFIQKYTKNPIIRVASDISGAAFGYGMSFLWLRYGPKKKISLPKRRMQTTR